MRTFLYENLHSVDLQNNTRAHFRDKETVFFSSFCHEVHIMKQLTKKFPIQTSVYFYGTIFIRDIENSFKRVVANFKVFQNVADAAYL